MTASALRISDWSSDVCAADLFVALGPAIARRPLPIRIGDVETAARAGSPKLMPLPPTPPEDARALIPKPGEVETARPPAPRATSPASADVLLQVARSRPPAPARGADVKDFPAAQESRSTPRLGRVGPYV